MNWSYHGVAARKHQKTIHPLTCPLTFGVYFLLASSIRWIPLPKLIGANLSQKTVQKTNMSKLVQSTDRTTKQKSSSSIVNLYINFSLHVKLEVLHQVTSSM